MQPAGDFNNDGIDDWMFMGRDPDELRGRVIVVAGDERFGQTVPDIPPFVADEFTLGAPFPNPFNGEVTIPLHVSQGTQQVDILIYNVLGQEVYSFGKESYAQGDHKIVWDGKSNTSESVTSGQYFVQATAGGQVATAAVRLVK
jgi:hypothetical protein